MEYRSEEQKSGCTEAQGFGVDGNEQEKDRLRAKCAYLAPWMKRLFWLVIPMIVMVIVTTDTVKNMMPSFKFVGAAVSVLCHLFYGIFLLKMSSQEKRYKTAGICRMVVAAVGAAIAFISGLESVTVISLVSVGFSIAGEYNEYKGHAAVMESLDMNAAVNWDKLCKWFVVVFAAIPVLLLMMIMIPAMAALFLLVFIADLLAIVVVSIIKLVYIYRTASLMEAYAAQ